MINCTSQGCFSTIGKVFQFLRTNKKGFYKMKIKIIDLLNKIANNEEGNCLNDEVEILDEAKEDKIQKIYHCETSLTQNEVEIFITKNLNQMVDKINELIDVVNKLKRDK